VNGKEDVMAAIARLGYLGFEVSDLNEWERFAVEILGLAVSERRADGGLALRMDDQTQRLVLHPGPRDDLVYAGFELDHEGSLRQLVEKLAAAGFTVAAASSEVACARKAARVYQATDPNGVPVELFWGPERSTDPFRSPFVASGFVTGDEGLGHVVFGTTDPEATERFYRDLLGMRLSDRIEVEPMPGFPLRITFLHANPRHHTVAFAAAPLPKRIHHFMLEVGAMEDVGRAYDRALDAGVPIANTLGVHPNDRMFSFYARTPSGFDVEFGWGGRKVDDATWKVGHYDRISIWGHRPEAHTPPAATGV
jgi:2,3-dihydroxybiphenyl 1,2-dioxygenase